MNRFERILAIIKGEKITLKNEELYKELLAEVDDEAFDTHVDALKEMAASGETYVLETTQSDDGVISVKTINETTGETSAETKPDETVPTVEELTPTVPPTETPAVTPEVPAPTDPIEPTIETKPEENIEPKSADMSVLVSAITELKSQMAKLLDSASKATEQTTKLGADFQAKFEELSKSIVPLKRKIKDFEDGQFNVSKKLPVDPVRKSFDMYVAPEASSEIFKSIFPENMQGDTLNFNKIDEDSSSDE